MSINSILISALLSVGMFAHGKTETLNLRNTRAQGVSASKMPAKNPPAQIYGQVRMEGMQYFTAIASQPQLTYSQLLSARLSGVKETSWLDFAADLSGGTFFARGQTHFVVHEAYAANHGNTDVKTYVGRKKKEWSELDRRWSLGLWQPSFAIDALRPEEQGLSGLFFNYNRPKLELLAFVTPIFIPSMGPDIREDGGGLVADSRWYRAPSRDYAFNDRINNIVYDLDIPETQKLVMNGGVGLMGRVGEKNSGAWMVASAGYKPVNELILKRQNFKDVSQDKVDVTVSPDIIYHYLYSLDLGYSFKNLKASVSVLHDQPAEKIPEADWSIQRLDPLTAYSSALDFSLDNIFTRTLAFQLEYLKVEGGGITDILSSGQNDDFTLFDQRLKFTNALSFRVEGQMATFFKKALVTRFKYLYDYDQQGSLWTSELLYFPGPQWAVLVGADILGVSDESHKVSGFLNQYRANDRVYGGITYVF